MPVALVLAAAPVADPVESDSSALDVSVAIERVSIGPWTEARLYIPVDSESVAVSVVLPLREAVTVLMRERRFGVTRACGLVQISRSLYRYRSRRPPCANLRERICEIAAAKRRYRYRRVHIMLRHEGWAVNRKLTYRLLYRVRSIARSRAFARSSNRSIISSLSVRGGRIASTKRSTL